MGDFGEDPKGDATQNSVSPKDQTMDNTLGVAASGNKEIQKTLGPTTAGDMFGPSAGEDIHSAISEMQSAQMNFKETRSSFNDKNSLVDNPDQEGA